LHTPAALLTGEQALVCTGYEAGWTLEVVWMLQRRAKPIHSCILNLSTILTELMEPKTIEIVLYI
jgi:hypothetical protein